MAKSVYIHIPFCQRICNYCDFVKRVSKRETIDQYIEALRTEIELYKPYEELDTLYIGGGTPSILTIQQLKQIEMMIDDYFILSEGCEFTVECNPEHVTEERVLLFKEMGVNRISLGVQTFNDRHLKLLNRGHTKEDVIRSVALLRQHGFDQINIDLIYAIPGQTLTELQDDLNMIKELNLEHVSAYSLILEEKTVFEKWLKEGKIDLVDNELEAKMFDYVMDALNKDGYHHYEISNFCKEGYESKHNKVYWSNDRYYGFGVGASGYLSTKRYYNVRHVNQYLRALNNNSKPLEQEDELSLEEQISEELILGLRLIRGVNLNDFKNKYNKSVFDCFPSEIKLLSEKGLIHIESDHLSLTKEGLLKGNDVFVEFLKS
ncbi:radical SAM family heme chaperone HemW [Haloplasma contractile]|uniref:Heme chaperone HemW n=1 Tax=Haloplasma contractile SSD-17B TaxID=1033810 RepID=U2FRS8_9MOLU|nr:radical SAM family heme chaperone HemW [Haloplasma contractile]ERJ13669.1 Oxygen-independent coproporphyrogen III oxidase protein [Haloplasma contractile SSD-17B]